MCSGIEIMHEGKRTKVYFPNPKAALPARKQGGGHVMLPWGARGVEYALGPAAPEPARRKWPQGGWARLESIEAGRWDTCSPLPARIPAFAYMEKDANEARHWFDLEPGQFIQGLVAKLLGERRIYVVTIPAPPQFAQIHDRWPRIVSRETADE